MDIDVHRYETDDDLCIPLFCGCVLVKGGLLQSGVTCLDFPSQSPWSDRLGLEYPRQSQSVSVGFRKWAAIVSPGTK